MQSDNFNNSLSETDSNLDSLLNQFVNDPVNAEVCMHIGTEYLKTGRYRYARAYLEKALQLNPLLQNASDYLAETNITDTREKEKHVKRNVQSGKYDTLYSYKSSQTILFIGDYFFPPVGGAEKSALTLLQEFCYDGHRCFAVCKGAGSDSTIDGIYVRHLSHPDLIEKTLFQIKPSLIITQLEWAYYGIALAKKHHIPSILFVRSYEYFCGTPVEYSRCDKNCELCTVHPINRTIKEKFKFTVENADEIICNSEYMRNVTREFYGRDSHVVYPTIALDEFIAEQYSRTFIVLNKPTRYKGAELFFELVKRMPDLRFMTVGRGASVHLPNCICYGQTDPLIFFQHARLLLAPSMWPEPFGRIAVEAMKNGIPVIASNDGGLPEIIGDAGILIDENRKIEAWETTVRSILSDKIQYENICVRAKERSRLFECEKQMERIRPIVNNVLEITEKSTDRRIVDFYNKQYGHVETFSFLFNHRRERLEGLCNMVHSDEFFLDIGCADGAHMEVLYNRNISGIGIDVSIPNIIRGMKRFPHLHFIHGFAEMIPFTDDFFDVALMGDILEHLRDPRAVIREVFRVARELAICVPIGGKTLEHISPYPTIDSVIDLFNDLDVSYEWYTPKGTTILQEQVVIAEDKPWVFLRVKRNNLINTMPLSTEPKDAQNNERNEPVRDEWENRTITRDYQEVTRFYYTAQIVEGPNVLEMACGNGDMSVVMAATGITLYSIDKMRKRIEWARKTALVQGLSKKVQFDIQDASNTDFPDNHFDTVIIPGLIERIKNANIIINEALRVAKPGGLILISVSDGPDRNPDHIRCFFRKTLCTELSQYTGDITWHSLPFRRWLIGTFHKPVDTEWATLMPVQKIMSIKEHFQDIPPNPLPLPGFNIIGPVGVGNEGGARVRGLIQGLTESGYPITVYEITIDGQTLSINPFNISLFEDAPLPYAINLFCTDAVQLQHIFSSAPPWLRLNNHLNVYLADDISLVESDSWHSQLNGMDMVFVLNAAYMSMIKKNNPSIHLQTIEIAPYIHKKGVLQRRDFDIPEESLFFITYIDMRYSPQSQNIDHIIEAFRGIEDSGILLGIVLGTSSGMNETYLDDIKKCIQDDPRIRLCEGIIGEGRIEALFNLADIGINCSSKYIPSPWTLEMMSNGKAVITLELPYFNNWIHTENPLRIPTNNVSDNLVSDFRNSIPDKNALQKVIVMCRSNPDCYKDAGIAGSLMVHSIRERFRNGGGAQLFNDLIEKVQVKREKTGVKKSIAGRHTMQSVDPIKTIEKVTRLVENRQFREAVLIYEEERPKIPQTPELVRFDKLMKKIKLQVTQE